ncbi:MAG TPA: ABC transporter permease [Burkholderiales bacterium]|nr:ABC transporter permease [Burkholderiales bacterium]
MQISSQQIVIEAGRSARHYWRDLWRYRELFLFLAWRDILVKYKQTVIGVAWAVVRPLLTMIIFTIVFGKLAKLPSEGIPYPVLVFSAMLPWYFFSSTFSEGSISLIQNANIISKVYFPRVIIPVSAVVVSLVDFVISFVLLLALMVWYQFIPDWRILFLPVFLILAVVVSMGPILWLAALNVKYRDVRFVVPFLIQLGLLISPVGFSSSIIPEQWRLIYSLNPMVGVIEAFRWSTLGGQTPLYVPSLISSLTIAALLLVSGIWYFRRTERSFADVI